MNREFGMMKVFGALVVVIVACAFLAEAGPAYGQSNYNNNWEEVQQPQQQQQQQVQRRNTNNQAQQGKRRTLQGMVRQHIDDLDKQTQSDLKILSYLEKELNQIFSCYIKLSCPRMRSAKTIAECDEIKDWPLYHQVMRMAGIRKYPYQSYAPQGRQGVIPPGRQERVMNDNDAEDTGATDDEIENDQYYQAATRPRQHQGNRRVRREHHHQHHHDEHNHE